MMKESDRLREKERDSESEKRRIKGEEAKKMTKSIVIHNSQHFDQ